MQARNRVMNPKNGNKVRKLKELWIIPFYYPPFRAKCLAPNYRGAARKSHKKFFSRMSCATPET